MRRPIYDTVRLCLPFDRVAEVVRAGPHGWLPTGSVAGPDGWSVPMEAPGVLSATVDTLVEVERLEEAPGLLVVPIGWRAMRAEVVFPRLQAELEFEHVTSDATRLTLVGAYKPPLSVVGAAADRLLGHVVAEGVVRNFLEAIGERIRVDGGTREPSTLHA